MSHYKEVIIMRNFKAITGVIAIFVLGIMTGILGTSLVVKSRIEKFHQKGPPHVKTMFMKRLSNKLDLSPAQKKSIQKILDKMQTDLQSIRQNVRPEIKSAFSAGFKEIRQELTEPQKKKFDLLAKKFPDRFPHRMKHKGRRWKEKMNNE